MAHVSVVGMPECSYTKLLLWCIVASARNSSHISFCSYHPASRNGELTHHTEYWYDHLIRSLQRSTKEESKMFTLYVHEV